MPSITASNARKNARGIGVTQDDDPVWTALESSINSQITSKSNEKENELKITIPYSEAEFKHLNRLGVELDNNYNFEFEDTGTGWGVTIIW